MNFVLFVVLGLLVSGGARAHSERDLASPLPHIFLRASEYQIARKQLRTVGVNIESLTVADVVELQFVRQHRVFADLNARLSRHLADWGLSLAMRPDDIRRYRLDPDQFGFSPLDEYMLSLVPSHFDRKFIIKVLGKVGIWTVLDFQNRRDDQVIRNGRWLVGLRRENKARAERLYQTLHMAIPVKSLPLTQMVEIWREDCEQALGSKRNLPP